MKKILCVFLIIVVGLAGYVFVKYTKVGLISKGTPIPVYEKSGKALLVIDLQRDLTTKNGKHVINLNQTDQVIENTNKIIERFKNRGFLVIYIKQIHDTGPIINLFTNGALAEGSKGSMIDSRVKIINDNVLEKRIMDAFSNPKLDSLLRSNQINQLYITGVAADQCVDRTSKAAMNRNYEVTIVSNAVGTFTDEKRDNKLKEFAGLGMKVITTDDLLKQL